MTLTSTPKVVAALKLPAELPPSGSGAAAEKEEAEGEAQASSVHPKGHPTGYINIYCGLPGPSRAVGGA